ncbi:type II toxin-antitoxin system VapB family antitoxin [Cellulomonas sp. NPDC057328]|uniref:type II toxin-antitoxin system VapB family antitoxin n=1 Tax=Cellulomonas sp. NPDC057328 TaxID=3346101 RepID=UPI003643AA5F
MAMTSVDLPEDLVAEVMRIFGARTKREAITASLRETVRRSRQDEALAALGGMAFAEDLVDPEVRAQARR